MFTTSAKPAKRKVGLTRIAERSIEGTAVVPRTTREEKERRKTEFKYCNHHLGDYKCILKLQSSRYTLDIQTYFACILCLY